MKGLRVFEGFEKCLRVFKSVFRGFKFGCYGNGSHVVLVCPYSSPLPLHVLYLDNFLLFEAIFFIIVRVIISIKF